MERFDCSTAVVSGPGALAALKEPGCRRLLVVTDPLRLEGGQAGRAAAASGCETVKYYDLVAPEPTMKQAVEGAGVVKQFAPELVAAVGGRNVVDCAKAMVCFSGQKCLLAAVPTRLAGGAEVTDQVILHHNHSRHLLQDCRMRPDLVILESAFGEAMIRAETAEGGFSLLSASLEAYCARSGGMITRLHAREAFAVCWGSLPAAFSGNGTARHRLQSAGVLTGLAWNMTGLGLCHALENSLGCLLHLPRGRLAGILLPAVVGCNAYAAGGRYAELARAAGMGASNEAAAARNLKMGLVRLRRELGMPGTLAQAGVPPRLVWDQVRQIVTQTLEDPASRNNPVAADDFLVRRILEEITGRM